MIQKYIFSERLKYIIIINYTINKLQAKIFILISSWLSKIECSIE